MRRIWKESSTLARDRSGVSGLEYTLLAAVAAVMLLGGFSLVGAALQRVSGQIAAIVP